MAERPKLLYIIVQDESVDFMDMGKRNLDEFSDSRNNGRMMALSSDTACTGKVGKMSSSTFRYTRPVLQSTLQLIGCKARHAFKISKRVFEILREENPVKVIEKGASASQDFCRHDFSRHLSDSEVDNNRDYTHEDIKRAAIENEIRLKEITKKLFTVQKRRSTVVLTRADFMDVVCDAMSEYRYVGPNQRSDFALASRIREKKASMTVLLCGTSGCGKSTLSTLLASRLGITTVVSTDSIRHMMRSFADEKQNPLLWASTYSAGEHLDPMAVAEAKAKKKAKKMARVSVDSHLDTAQTSVASTRENEPSCFAVDHLNRSEKDIKGKSLLLNEVLEAGVSAKTMAVQGYKAQSEMVIDSLDRLITSWEQKCESVIIEGVHLSLNFVMGLVKKHPSVIPFMVYIANEEKHLERFAVRAKYMTLDPAKNKYVKYIRNIRAIQDYQYKRADKHLIPKVNNTNMDKSVACIHATIFGCLRRREAGESFYDQTTNTVKVVDEEYRNQCAAYSLGSKGMLQVLQRKGSCGQFMALVNTDGSVAKTWPFTADDAGRVPSTYNGNSSTLLRYGLEVSPVNLQFGNFGLSAWPNDIGEPSHNGSLDGLSSRGDGTDNPSQRSSRYGSSCSSSPRLGEGTEKELVNENAVSGSDEEQEEEPLDADSEEELTDGRGQRLEEELEGSVDDQSIGSEDDDDCTDEYAETDQDGRSSDAQRLDSLDCTNRNVYRATEAEKNLRKQSFQESGQSNLRKQSLQESGRSNGGAFSHADRITVPSNIMNFNTQSVFKEANLKHLHGRSKSLPPFFGNCSTAWDSSNVLEVVKRV